jgi:methylphosphotriester-DNA--protein-cysteine methyltransferase
VVGVKYIFLLFLFFNSQVLFAQNTQYRVETITIDDGLFVNYAHSIIQDSIGFIWMGSDYGLQNYDVFHFDPLKGKFINYNENLYLRSFRLKEAGRLIREEQQGVSEAAYKVGFNSLSYFSKCFKEEFGYSPSNTLEQRGIES